MLFAPKRPVKSHLPPHSEHCQCCSPFGRLLITLRQLFLLIHAPIPMGKCQPHVGCFVSTDPSRASGCAESCKHGMGLEPRRLQTSYCPIGCNSSGFVFTPPRPARFTQQVMDQDVVSWNHWGIWVRSANFHFFISRPRFLSPIFISRLGFISADPHSLRLLTLKNLKDPAPGLCWADEKSVLITSIEPRSPVASIARSKAAVRISSHSYERNVRTPRNSALSGKRRRTLDRGQERRHGATALQALDLRVAPE
jgi:hypothetical protein